MTTAYEPIFDDVESVVLAENVSLDGQTRIDTGIKLFAEDRDWTMVIDGVYEQPTEGACLVSCFTEDGFHGFKAKYRGGFAIQWSSNSVTDGVAKGVTWKGNVQRFLFHAVLELKRLKDGLLRGELKVDKSIRLIVLHERGKLRKVHAVMIDCRTVQGCLCDSSLIPLTKHKLIRDNPASVKGRGITDARNRIVLFFCELAKKHLDKFYLMSTDFISFFDSIMHQDCLKVLRESQADLWIQGLGMKINRMYQESELDQIPDPEERAKRKYMLEHNRGIGLTLGSQESQIMAVLVPSPLDHAVKEGANSLRAYERYMDDTLSGHHSKDKLKDVGRTIQKEAAKKGLRLNPRKTIITKASKGIRFLQIHYWVTKTGHLVKELGRQSIVRMRRKLKKFKKRVDAGKMKMDAVFASFMSWFGNGHYTDSYRTRKKMLNLYNSLFHHYRTEGVYA